MRSRLQLALHVIDHSFKVLDDNIATLTLSEALFVPGGGYRSILGLIKHAAGWSHVYHSYAFEPAPRHWKDIDWPRGRRDTIELAQDYLLLSMARGEAWEEGEEVEENHIPTAGHRVRRPWLERLPAGPSTCLGACA